ncbi:MAG: Jag N-terminal domain-containing protein [Clostridium paraputrificum]
MDCNFMGKNLEECLCEAERQLSIPRNELVYKIIKEEKSIFRKHC